MSDSAYPARAPEFEDYGDDGFEHDELPGRPRRQFLNRWSAAALALLVGAAGFYVGVRIEKSKVTAGGSSSSGLASAFASRFGSSGRAGASGGFPGASSTGSGSRSTGARGTSATAGGYPGALAGANASVGTVSSVNGDTLYIKESDGNTVKVKLTRETAITKRETVKRGKVNPGDTVVIETSEGSGGKLTATSLTDSGSTSTGSGSSSTGSTGSSGSSSVISSLFGGG